MKTMEPDADTWLLRGGTVVDGTGTARYDADVRIEQGRIAEMGIALASHGERELDARGRIIAPGFIDTHTHDDQLVLAAPQALPKISQGVTTVVVGNCGISLAPLVHPNVPPPLNLLGGTDKHVYGTMRSYVDAVVAAQPAVNVVALVGHSTLRVAAMADPYRPATGDEQARMVALTREAMEAGAAGLSSGVFYPTGAAADAAEVALLARVVAEAGGVYATHIRDEREAVIEAMEEAFWCAREAALPVIISHHKCAGPKNWGRTVETLAYLDAARRKQPIALDAYPYAAASTVLRTDMVDGVIDVIVAWSDPHPEAAGRSLADIAREWDCTQQEACERLQPGGAIYFQMREDDVRRVLEYPATMIGSDGLPHDRHPHPRLWGTFPRVLGHYARDVGLFTLEEAVHRMTGLSARRLNLRDRGEIRIGNVADIVVFDPDRIIDRATYESPTQPADGVDLVMVGGTIAYRERQPTGVRVGRFIARQTGP